VLRRTLSVAMALGLFAGPALSQSPVPTDAEVKKGIRQVDEGDYDAAIVTLDAASRRLVTQKAKTRDLSQAYLYLGIAYVAKGHEAAAKAKFREALAQIKDLSLSTDRYPPKVIDLFEAAKDEATTDARATRTSAARKTGGGGSKKLLIIGGAVALAGGGAALALGGGEPPCDTFFAGPSGLLNDTNTSFGLTTTPTEAGSWEAELSWTVLSGAAASAPRPAPPRLVLFVVDAATGQDVAEPQVRTTTSSVAEWEGRAGQTFRIGFDLVDGGSVNYTLSVTGPCRF